MKKNYTCIICPQSCDITLEEANGTITVAGNRCNRGKDYALSEHKAPVRMITTTISVAGTGPARRLPVISSGPVPKEKLRACLAIIYDCQQTSPAKMGDVIIENILDTGVDIIAAKNLDFRLLQGAN